MSANAGSSNAAAATTPGLGASAAAATAATAAASDRDTDGPTHMEICNAHATTSAGTQQAQQQHAATSAGTQQAQQLQQQAAAQQQQASSAAASQQSQRPLTSPPAQPPQLGSMTTHLLLLDSVDRTQARLKPLLEFAQVAGSDQLGLAGLHETGFLHETIAYCREYEQRLQMLRACLQPFEEEQRARATNAAGGAAHSTAAAASAAAAGSSAVAAEAAGSSAAHSTAAAASAAAAGSSAAAEDGRAHSPLYVSWPQHAASAVSGGTRDLTAPQLQPHQHPINAVYVAHINKDHVNVRYVIPRALVALLTAEKLNAMLDTPLWRVMFDLRWSDELKVEGKSLSPAQKSRQLAAHEAAGEYDVAECMALPLHLMTYPALNLEFTRMHTFALLVHCFFEYGHADLHSRFRGGVLIPFDLWLREKIRSSRARAAGSAAAAAAAEPEPLSPCWEAVLELWRKVASCDVLILPSVLLLPSGFPWGADGWYDRVNYMAMQCGCSVFPRIEVERKMENKDMYMRSLNLHNSYKPLANKLEQLRHAQHSGAVIPFPPSLPVPTWYFDRTHRYQGLGLIPPTVFVPLGPDTNLSVSLTEALKKVKEGATAGQWQWRHDRYCIKGANSTRVSYCVREASVPVADLAAACKQISSHSQQKCLLVQPELTTLHRELRLFFANGCFLTAVQTDPVSHGVVELRFTTVNRAAEAAQRQLEPCPNDILPQVVDHAAFVLSACESHCQLVSSSGLLRVDVGVEYVLAPPQHIVSQTSAGQEFVRWATIPEREASELQNIPKAHRHQWQCSGLGWIFRVFTNEVTSSLDINIYAVRSQRCSLSRSLAHKLIAGYACPARPCSHFCWTGPLTLTDC